MSESLRNEPLSGNSVYERAMKSLNLNAKDNPALQEHINRASS